MARTIPSVADRMTPVPRVIAPHETLEAVEHVMTRKPYTVRRETPIHEAARVMAQRKLGSAVVVDGKKVVGILTTTDALAALVDLVEVKLERSAFERTALGPVRPRTRQPTREARR